MRAHAAVQFLTCLFAAATNQADRLLIVVDCEMNRLCKKDTQLFLYPISSFNLVEFLRTQECL